jgi:hypothetical protein
MPAEKKEFIGSAGARTRAIRKRSIASARTLFRIVNRLPPVKRLMAMRMGEE